MNDRVGIERLCMFGMPPVEFVELAADLGVHFIGVGLTPMRRYNPHAYPDWSLKDDARLRRAMIAAMRTRDVSISLCEGFGVRPGGDVRDFAPELDVAAELGAARINAASADPDVARTFDQFAALAEMAGAHGITTVIEIGPGPVNALDAALAAARHVGRADFGLLIDTMHFIRLGGTAAALATVDPALIGYVQLCDAPLVSKHERYMDEALYERMAPGAGELPLLDILAVVPRDVVVSVEVPQRSLADAGIGAHARVGACVQAARSLLARLPA